LEIGQTIYVEGHEMVITAMRLDRGVTGDTALVWLSDPILYQKDLMDRQAKEQLVHTHRIALETVTKAMGDE